MDLYKEITERIMAQMENGVIPWHKPWISGKAISRTTGKPYSLLNQMMLGKPGEYLTFKQCQAEGGKVKKGEKAQMVVFWKWMTVEDEETKEEKEVPFLRYYNVFHIDQCEGLRPKYEITLPGTAEPDTAANEIIYDYLSRSGVVMKHESGDRAYYQPMTDTVVIPERKQFAETAEFYSTIFHELTHSTGHESRLNRLEKDGVLQYRELQQRRTDCRNWRSHAGQSLQHRNLQQLPELNSLYTKLAVRAEKRQALHRIGSRQGRKGHQPDIKPITQNGGEQSPPPVAKTVVSLYSFRAAQKHAK